MKIAFSEVHGRELHRRISEDGWFPHEEMTLDTPVDGIYTIRRIGSGEIEVAGKVSAGITDFCHRCGKQTPVKLVTEFSYECIVGSDEMSRQREAEFREQDGNKLYLEEPVINIGDILREQVFLAMPSSVLCRQACKGLCHQCGENLNRGKCGCQKSNPSSPFAILEKIKGK